MQFLSSEIQLTFTWGNDYSRFNYIVNSFEETLHEIKFNYILNHFV